MRSVSIQAGVMGALVVLLAGCGAAQSGTVTPVTVARHVSSAGDRSWVAPEAATDDLLYVGGNNGYISMYSFPKGTLVGVINNPDFYLPSGECVDAASDVFITSLGNEKIFEYGHGSKKLKQTLQAATNDPVDCSVDPTTGNLAVTTLGFGSSGNVAIYQHAQGSPTTYTDPHIYNYFFCGYDKRGNLFVDGQGYSTKLFRVAELPNGSSKFIDLTMNHMLDFPGSILWHGKYLAVGDQATPDVYEFAISGSTGTLKKTTPINGNQYDAAFWIQDKTLVAATEGGSYQTVDFYSYPAGGNPTKIIRKDVAGPDGLTISVAPTASRK
jgi:hypothetical protein